MVSPQSHGKGSALVNQRVPDKLLMVTTLRWISAAQLAIAFAELGWSVDAVCPKRHPLERTTTVARTFRYRPFRPLHSLRDAILTSKPVFVIAMDDPAAGQLQRLRLHAEQHRHTSQHWAFLYEVLDRSLASTSSYITIASRSSFAALAASQKIAMPSTVPLHSEQYLLNLFARDGVTFPLVLKADGTSGGEGVRIVRSPQEALTHYRNLQQPLSLVIVLKRAFFDHNFIAFVPWLLRRRSSLSLQQYIAGVDANVAVACWKGEVLALVAVEVLQAWRTNGPSAIVRVIHNAAMTETATALVRALGVSGFCGFDFMLDSATGVPHLIEMNGRATPTCHLALGRGRDLPAALSAVLRSTPSQPVDIQERPIVTDNEIIGLFPLSWHLEEDNAYLEHAYRDLPAGETDLVAIGLAPMQSPRRKRWRRRFERLSRASVLMAKSG